MTRRNPGLPAVEDVIETCDELREIAVSAQVALLTGVDTDAIDSLADALGSMVVAGNAALRRTYVRIGAFEECPPEVEPLLGAAVALTMAVEAEKVSTELAAEVLDSSQVAAMTLLCDDTMTPRIEVVAEAAIDALRHQGPAKALEDLRNNPICRSYLRDLHKAPFGTRLLQEIRLEGEPPDH